jgi:hypothetical protein
MDSVFSSFRQFLAGIGFQPIEAEFRTIRTLYRRNDG